MDDITTIDYDSAFTRLSPAGAVAALRDAIRAGRVPSSDPLRASLPVDNGAFLLMPSVSSTAFGIKLLSVANADYRPDLARIKGTYVLFDATTLAPTAYIDGAAITNLRTPAVSLAGVLDFFSPAPVSLHVVIFGTGPQARAHAATVRDCFPECELDLVFCSRSRPDDVDLNWVEAGSDKARGLTRSADLILLTTTAREPIIHRGDVSDSAVIIAVGSHEPDAREVAGDIMRDAHVIIEDWDATFAEGGDVILAEKEGTITRDRLVTWTDVITGQATVERDRPIVFKFTGMAWEDLVIAEAIAAQHA